jgi:hypothetical protein
MSKLRDESMNEIDLSTSKNIEILLLGFGG